MVSLRYAIGVAPSSPSLQILRCPPTPKKQMDLNKECQTHANMRYDGRPPDIGSHLFVTNLIENIAHMHVSVKVAQTGQAVIQALTTHNNRALWAKQVLCKHSLARAAFASQ